MTDSKGYAWKQTKAKLDPLNVKKGIFDGDGEWEIPTIRKQDVKVTKLVPFGKKNKDGFAHFYMDDYAFERLWNKPRKYIMMVLDYHGIFSPDFSPYDTYPLALQLYNVYRNRWCGAFYQSLGANVIPTITWSGKRSFDFAFKGVEKGSTVTVSTVGLWMQKEYLKLFPEGYEIMMEEIKPEKVIGYGKPVEGLDGNIEWFKSFAEERLRKIDGR